MTQCPKCLGDGLIGNGDNPHLKEGRIVTCPDCNGTGLVPEEVVENVVSAEPVNTPVDETVDNAILDNGSLDDSSSGGEVLSEESVPVEVPPVDVSAEEHSD